MLSAAFAKGAATNVPASDATGKNHLQRLRPCACRPVQTSRESEFVAGATKQTRGWLGQEFFTRAVDELQTLITVERKDGYVDLAHECAQQRRRFHRAQSLFAQSLAEVVDFQHDFAERIACKRAAPAYGKVTFTNRGENV